MQDRVLNDTEICKALELNKEINNITKLDKNCTFKEYREYRESIESIIKKQFKNFKNDND